ncbi:polysaccharide deacetylase family protein [Kocuria carniphila]|uniref:polysaccharide deacetylase family protein n=1 Tax=Kocuria carniphila TaxID=262208 RepID=UPI0034CF930D
MIPVQQPPDGINLDDERSNKDFMIRNTTAANAVTGGWPDALGIPRSAAWVSVRVTMTGLVFQQMQTYGSDPRLLIRSTRSTSPSPYPFSEWKDVTAPPAPVSTGAVPLGVHAGVANAVLLQDFTRRRPVVKTGGKPVLALRFDHGLANFNTMVVQHLKRLDLPAAICLNAGDWARTENNGVTKEMVNTWVGEGWLEIWNHALNHVDITDPAKFQEQIVTGLKQLRADLPAATIDGFMPVGSGPYIDFNGGNTVESWWSTDAGRLILQHHAVASGYIPGTVYRVLDGQPRQGQGHFTVDTMTLDDMQVRVEGAYSPVRGVQLMLHPSRLDTTGYLTSADYVAFLEWVAAERDAGRLVVLGAYDMLRADATS